MMEAQSSSKMSVLTRATRHDIPEDGIPDSNLVYFVTGSPWGNCSPGVDEERKAVHQKIEKKNNVLPLWGNERTMNLNPMILTNIQSSHYFKGFEISIYCSLDVHKNN
jgi:hypothetical protein